MNGKPVEYFNRYSGQMETEAIYGEKWLRFAYENPLGRAAVAMVFARPLFSRWYGWRMSRPASAARIAPFIHAYHIDVQDFADPPEAFASFNAFFSRALKPHARPVDADPAQIGFPADGRHLGFPVLGTETTVFVKGQRWDLAALLGDAESAARFHGGTLVLSRLCPVDYHRFHYPCDGQVVGQHRCPGPLYSVSPIALRRRLAYLWENERQVTCLSHPHIGDYRILEIGATNVGSIVNAPLPASAKVAKGDLKGWFEFGGSSLITLFLPGAVRLADDLLESSARGIELYARANDRMATVRS